jgi:NAD+ synthase
MPDRNLDYNQISKDMTEWLQNKANDAWLNWFVVWVSGWVDSAVVSTIAAMTWKATTVLELPIHQRRDEISRAEEHINWLQAEYSNITKNIVDLTKVFDIMVELQPMWINDDSEYLANVNLRSRLRATQIYSIANRNNALVVWTWNKVEDYWIGFFTKYWDWAVDVSPIWELYKSEVYNLAEYLGINKNILTASPTDWLHENGATDEDQIGASYDELEWAMIEYDNWKRISNFEWREKEIMKIYQERHEQNYHKMEMPPVFWGIN